MHGSPLSLLSDVYVTPRSQKMKQVRSETRSWKLGLKTLLRETVG